MLKRMTLQRFKCFANQTFPLGKLNLWAGPNNCGKSSAVQALILMRQAVEYPTAGRDLFDLNGPLVNLGTAGDVFCQWAKGDETIELSVEIIDLQQVKQTFTWELAVDREKHFNAPSLRIIRQPDPTSIPLISLFHPNVSYISAERQGPQLIYPVSREQEACLHVGLRGEYTAYCIDSFTTSSKTIANAALKFTPGDPSELFSYQLERWMNLISPSVEFKAERIVEADILTLRVFDRNQGSRHMRLTNVGFGISYCLPIIVAALMSPKDSMLVVENPEAHLHPRAQSQIAQFLAKVVAAGVQVIVETHSDHVLNGIRIAVKDGTISCDDLSLLYFNQDHSLSFPHMDAHGRVGNAPEGFFDQMEKDLLELI